MLMSQQSGNVGNFASNPSMSPAGQQQQQPQNTPNLNSTDVVKQFLHRSGTLGNVGHHHQLGNIRQHQVQQSQNARIPNYNTRHPVLPFQRRSHFGKLRNPFPQPPNPAQNRVPLVKRRSDFGKPRHPVTHPQNPTAPNPRYDPGLFTVNAGYIKHPEPVIPTMSMSLSTNSQPTFSLANLCNRYHEVTLPTTKTDTINLNCNKLAASNTDAASNNNREFTNNQLFAKVTANMSSKITANHEFNKMVSPFLSNNKMVSPKTVSPNHCTSSGISILPTKTVDTALPRKVKPKQMDTSNKLKKVPTPSIPAKLRYFKAGPLSTEHEQFLMDQRKQDTLERRCFELTKPTLSGEVSAELAHAFLDMNVFDPNKGLYPKQEMMVQGRLPKKLFQMV